MTVTVQITGQIFQLCKYRSDEVMNLSSRPPLYTLPTYSLTSDILGFIRCGLQYRYTRVGRLPSSRPVQMWFGQFIHGVMEESFLKYAAAKKQGQIQGPPWTVQEIDEICDAVQDRLRVQGLVPWTPEVEAIGRARAQQMINELGPDLFPLIYRAEVRLTGARLLPALPAPYQIRVADRYEIAGVVDVITHVQLQNPATQSNKLVQAIIAALPKKVPKEFEIIVDYKGMRRPSLPDPKSPQPSLWNHHEWQVQTYAHLRQMHEDSHPIIAGVLVYVNELEPSKQDLLDLMEDVRNNRTDVRPDQFPTVDKLLKGWKKKDVPPALPAEFRLKRALHITPVDPHSIQEALGQFDKVVQNIEICRAKETLCGNIMTCWDMNNSDYRTCTACDSKTFCTNSPEKGMPKLPGIKLKP